MKELAVELVVDHEGESRMVSCAARGRSRSIAGGAGFSCSTAGTQARSSPLHRVRRKEDGVDAVLEVEGCRLHLDINFLS